MKSSTKSGCRVSRELGAIHIAIMRETNSTNLGVILRDPSGACVLRKKTSQLRKDIQKFIQLAALSLILCLPFQSLAAQERDNTITFAGEVWTIEELPSLPKNYTIADPSTLDTNSFAIFNIIKSGKLWLVGGNLTNPSAELVYVDQETKTLGPYGSSNIKRSFCEAKSSVRKELAQKGQYSVCRSEFYTSSKLEKGAQAVIACLLIACLGGYDSSWVPVFRPNKFKQALSSSSEQASLGASTLMESFAVFFRNKELSAIQQQATRFNNSTHQIVKTLNSINYGTKDIAIARSDTALVKDLSEHHKRNLQYFHDNTRPVSKLPLGLNLLEIQNEQKKILPYSQTTEERIEEIAQLLTANLNKLEKLREIELATLNKLEKLREIELATVRKIQNLLSEHLYSSLAVDGLFGPSTVNALENFYSDVDVPIELEDKQKILRTIESSYIEPVGTCPRTSNDSGYTICFTSSQ